MFLDSYSGEELGKRTWGAISQGRINLVSFIYELHYSLALSMTGVWILGIVALAWTIDCFVSLYLTLPARRKKAFAPLGRATGKSWWASWAPAEGRGTPAAISSISACARRRVVVWAVLLILHGPACT